jgi:hypothetical protein
VPNDKKLLNNNLSVGSSQSQITYQDNDTEYSHKGENCHSKCSTEKEEGLDLEYLKPELKGKIKEELIKSDREQLLLLKNYKQNFNVLYCL